MKFPAFEPIDLKNSAQSFEAMDLLLSQIKPDKNQPRKNFDAAALDELASSIKKQGVIQPIIVREMGEDKKYQIIAGERRWRAASIAGLEKIPAIIKQYDKANRMAVSLIENIQRENLNPLEEAAAIQSLLQECFMTHAEVAENIGRSRATVTNLLRLLSLTTKVKEMISSGLLEMGHARALLSLSDALQIEIADMIILKSLSVRQAEKIVQRINMLPLQHEITHTSEIETKFKTWKASLPQKFSSRINVKLTTKGKGKLIIQFDSIEDADWLMDHLSVTELSIKKC